MMTDMITTPTEDSHTETDLLGEIITWDAQSAEIDIDRIRGALRAAGLDEKEARDLNNRSAFSRAARHLKDNRSIDKVTENTKTGVIVFQLTRKAIHDDKVDFDYECQVNLDTKTGYIACNESPEIESQARALFKHAMQVRTASDITRLVQKLFKAEADLFPINPRRGVGYFVPEAHRGFTAQVQHFMAQVGGSLWRFPVPKGTKQGNDSVRDAVSNGLEALLEEIKEAVDGWDDSTRDGTIKRGIEKWRQIKHKAESYAGYLQANQEALLEKIAAAKAELLEKAQSIRAEDEPAAQDA